MTLLRSLLARFSKSQVASQSSEAAVLEWRNAERQSVIDKARDLPLLDGVFSILLYDRHQRTLGPAPHARSVELAEVFPSVSDAQLAEAQSSAVNLIASAYSTGDSLLAGKFANSSEVQEKLATEHPGFGTKSYADTVYYGCFIAR